ncbi:MAG: Fur family transcriptional regulator [Planctomycetota bacterium]
MVAPRELPHFTERCRALGLPLTAQRRAIFDVLRTRTDHPTADDVARALEQRLPGTSRATVYRTLEALVTNGLIQRVSHPATAARYDVRIDRHHHLVCDRCSAMSDLAAAAFDDLALPDFASSGFRVRDYSVQVQGLCRRCARDRRDPSAPARRGRARRRPTRQRKPTRQQNQEN